MDSDVCRTDQRNMTLQSTDPTKKKRPCGLLYQGMRQVFVVYEPNKGHEEETRSHDWGMQYEYFNCEISTRHIRSSTTIVIHRLKRRVCNLSHLQHINITRLVRRYEPIKTF